LPHPFDSVPCAKICNENRLVGVWSCEQTPIMATVVLMTLVRTCLALSSTWGHGETVVSMTSSLHYERRKLKVGAALRCGTVVSAEATFTGRTSHREA